MAMYRESAESLACTVERLERELAALRAPARPRERVLGALTALSVVAALLSVAALRAEREHAAALEDRFEAAAVRLQAKTDALGECESSWARSLGEPLGTR